MAMHAFFRLVTLLSIVALLTGCGFHLRGQTTLPFKSIYLDVSIPGTAFINELRHNLEANHVQLADTSERADIVLNIVSEASDKQILSIGGAGRVTEFRLTFRVSLRAYDLKQQDLVPAVEMELHRDFTFDDSKILAKEAEEALLMQSMRSDMVQQILRRLSRVNLQLPGHAG